MSASANNAYGYIIVFHEPDNVYNSYGVPNVTEIPSVIYKTYTAAENAILSAVTKFENFTGAAYGVAYPYENTTFVNELNTKGFALLGWVHVEEDGERARIPLGILRLSYSG